MDNSGVLKIENLSVSFNGKQIFGGVSGIVRAGEKFLVSGVSGAGKSTLLKCLLGFTPFTGKIYFGNLPLNSENIREIRLKSAYIPQEPVILTSRVLDFIKEPFSYEANRNMVFEENRLDEMLERFLLPLSIKHANTDQLSGGEKQRIAIISAMLLGRQFMFFDEPTSALDLDCRKVFAEIIGQMSNATCVIVSHDKNILSSVDGEIRIISDGGRE